MMNPDNARSTASAIRASTTTDNHKKWQLCHSFMGKGLLVRAEFRQRRISARRLKPAKTHPASRGPYPLHIGVTAIPWIDTGSTGTLWTSALLAHKWQGSIASTIPRTTCKVLDCNTRIGGVKMENRPQYYDCFDSSRGVIRTSAGPVMFLDLESA
jgi:hypothetical protein